MAKELTQSWEAIAETARKGSWAVDGIEVGDYKALTLNGTVGTLVLSNYDCFAVVIGFDHNAEKEIVGYPHAITFALLQKDGTQLCLIDQFYSNSSSNTAAFAMNPGSSESNAGGWVKSNIRKNVLGSTDTADGRATPATITNPVANSLMAALPTEVRNVLKPIVKYTDCKTASNRVRPTVDYLPLMAEFEVFGTRNRAYEGEKNYQKQYQYYIAGNSAKKYRHSSASSTAQWLLRSPHGSWNDDFCSVGTGGTADSADANYSYGLSPVFNVCGGRMQIQVDLTTLPGYAALAEGAHSMTVVAKASGCQNSNPSAPVTFTKVSAYNITTNIANGTATGATSIGIGGTVVVTIVPNEGYNAPFANAVSVTNATFEYDTSAHTVTISNPTGEVTINAECNSFVQVFPTKIDTSSDPNWGCTKISNMSQSKVYSVKFGSIIQAYAYDAATSKWIMLNTSTNDIYLDSQTSDSIIFHYDGGAYFEGEWNISVTALEGDRAATEIELGYFTGALVAGGWACIIEGTPITLADGSMKSIEDITYDDNILVWNFYEGKFDSAKPCWITKPQVATEYNLVTFNNGAQIGFVGQGGKNGYHRIYNDEAKFFTHTGVAETSIGTHTFAEDGTFPELIEQEVIKKSVRFYNVGTEKHINLFANGILTSSRISNKYAIDNMKYVGERLISEEEERVYVAKVLERC